VLPLKENLWENVKGILNIHVDPTVDSGKFVLLDGVVHASSTLVAIEMSGTGGHTSKPHETVDLISAAGFYIVQLQSFLRQRVDPREIFVLTFGSINGGSAHNVIPQNISIRGTLRTFNNEVLDQIKELIHRFL